MKKMLYLLIGMLLLIPCTVNAANLIKDDLVNAALEADFKEYEREIVGKAKEPTFLDDGIIISKHLITKADKKLLKVYIGFFTYNDSRHVAVKFEYERFVIIEVFNLI